MEQNRNHNEFDNFSKLIKDRLENHQLAVDDNCWLEIEERLNNNKRKPAIPLWTWISGGVAIVAAIALLLVFPPYNDFSQQNEIAKQTDSFSNEQLEQVIKSINPPKEIFPVSEASNSNFRNESNPSSRSLRKENLIISSNKSEAKKEQNDSLKQALEEIAIDNVVKTETTENDSKSKNEKTIDKARKTELPEYNPYDKSNADWQAPKKTKKQNSWLVAASVNTGGRASLGNNAMDMAPENNHGGNYLENPDKDISSGKPNEQPETPTDEESSTGENNPNNNYQGTILDNAGFSNVTHLPPLSFGVRVRKDFNKHFALESGLTYTYLSSKFSSGNSYGKEATLNMHYLGIPVNAVVYFTNNSKWNVYFLAGGMVEKGIWSNYWERNYLSNGKSYDYSDSDHIKGLQWSLNASFGVGYNFYRNFSIYFEPNIAYYLENNQPLSVRTESPLIVGLSAGIRFRFD